MGGCVRDLLLGREPADWDVTTNAKPEEIQKLFPRSFYTNKFGTVTVLTHASPSPSPTLGEGGDAVPSPRIGEGKDEVEVTTYRVDATYSDQRHPDKVEFTRSLKEDLARRDFTINAMALTPALSPVSTYEVDMGKDAVKVEGYTIVDLFGGINDLNGGLIRAVGEPKLRFGEDALRLLRAVRLAAQLGFEVQEATLTAVKEHAQDIKAVAGERIRDELKKIVMSSQPEKGFMLLEETGLLKHILPELQEGVGVGQNLHHKFTVFVHNIKSLQYAADFGYPLPVRLAALLHDAGKPRTKRPKGNDNTFYGHEIVGERLAAQLMRRLHFSNDQIEEVAGLVRHHMFYYDIGKVTEAGARRLLRRVGGAERFRDLIKLRMAERKGSGVPKAEPYRLRHLQFLVEKAQQEPVTVGELKINGGDLIKELGLKPGPQIGGILNALLKEVLDDPGKNSREYLLQRAEELKDKNPKDLKAMGEEAKEQEDRRREEEIKRKYHV